MDFVKDARIVVAGVKKLHKKYKDWDTLTPMEQHKGIFELGNVAALMVGLRVLHDCRINAYSYLLSLVLLVYYVLAIYTIFVRTSQGRFGDGITCLSIFGLYTSSGVGYYLVAFAPERYEMRRLVEYCDLNIYNDDNAPTKYNQICRQNIKTGIRRLKFVMFIMYASIVIGSAYPLKVFMDTGKFTSLTGVLIPGVEEGSKTEMMLNICYLSVSSVVAGISMLVIEVVAAAFCDAIVVQFKLTIFEMEELSDHLERNNLNSAQVRLRVKRFLMQILKQEEYISRTNECIFWVLFVTPFVITYSMAIALYSQYMRGFPAGYGIAGMSYIQLFVPCILGQIALDRQHEMHIGVGNFKWYLLRDNDLRLNIVSILHQLQNCSVFTIGPFEVLCYETASKLTQKIHSFMMLLVNFAS